MGNSIRVIPNFVSDEDCAEAIAMIDSFDSKKELEKFNTNMDVMVVPDNIPAGVAIIKKYSDKVLKIYKEEYGFVPPLYTTEGWLSLWEENAVANVHMDAYEGYDHIIYATIMYLNDSSEYSGGEIHFPNQGFTHRPKKGDAIIFPTGGHEYVHGVNRITSGRRYTIPMWHTKRPDMASKLFHPGVSSYFKKKPADWFSVYADSRDQDLDYIPEDERFD
jgi:hypothetical protein